MPNFGMGGPSANREQQGEQMDTSQAEPSDQQNPGKFFLNILCYEYAYLFITNVWIKVFN